MRPVLTIDEPEEVTPANLAAYPLSGDCTKGGGGHPSDCSRNFLAYVYDTTVPTTPTLDLLGETTGTSSTPNVRVSGVTPGELINI